MDETEAQLRAQKKIRPCNDDGSAPEFWELQALIFRPDQSAVTEEMRAELMKEFFFFCAERGWNCGCGGVNLLDKGRMRADLALTQVHRERGISWDDLARGIRVAAMLADADLAAPAEREEEESSEGVRPLTSIFRFPNGAIAAFDQKREQVPEIQRYTPLSAEAFAQHLEKWRAEGWITPETEINR